MSVVYYLCFFFVFFFFSSRRRHTRWTGDWSSDVCSSDLGPACRSRAAGRAGGERAGARTGPARRACEIGRASCRERVEISVGGGSLKKKKRRERAREGG